MALRFPLTISALVVFLFVPAVFAEDAPPARFSPPPEERVVVTTTRLPDPLVPPGEVPALVTVLDREEIERRGARTVQDLLAPESGILVFDQVGNGVQQTLGLRGFASGAGTAVFLDGARLNDPRSGAVALELVPVDALDRVEIFRGAAAPLAGGGSQAGVVHLHTRRAAELAGGISAAAGSDSASRLSAEISGTAGRFDGFASLARDEDGGFRENAGGDIVRFSGSMGLDLGAGRRLALTLTSSSLEWGNPGALTQVEWRSDPDASPYNRLDRADDRSRLAVLQFVGAFRGGLSLAANLSGTTRETESLSTGRAAPVFGGFLLDAEGDDLGSTVQATHAWERGSRRNRFTAGIEWRDGTTDSRGFFTDPSDPGSADRSNPDADNRADRRAAALYVQNVYSPAPSWDLTIGARADRDRIRYRERAPDPALGDARTYEEVSLRAGATFRPSKRLGVWAAYGESFLPPTVEEAFAFPGFGSNPDLEPEDARSIEAGARGTLGAVVIEGAAFSIDTESEIVFDPTPTPSDPFGRNVNEGRTRRRGVELAARGPAGERVRWFLTATLLDAEIRRGPNTGRRVPLTPGERFGAGLDLDLPGGFGLRLDAVHVSDQVLDNDPENAQPRLPAYTVANLRGSWAREAGRGLRLFAEIRNLFDERYATRGIWAFDFSTFESAAFYTPAPGRRVTGGAEWRF